MVPLLIKSAEAGLPCASCSMPVRVARASAKFSPWALASATIEWIVPELVRSTAATRRNGRRFDDEIAAGGGFKGRSQTDEATASCSIPSRTRTRKRPARLRKPLRPRFRRQWPPRGSRQLQISAIGQRNRGFAIGRKRQLADGGCDSRKSQGRGSVAGESPGSRVDRNFARRWQGQRRPPNPRANALW